MPWFEVTVQATKTICIEAENADEAQTDAYDEVFIGCDKECFGAKLLETAEEIERSKRHADEVFALP